MSNYDHEQKAMDAAIYDEDAGLVLQTVGWTILSFCAVVGLFIFVGWRSGSWFWFWMTLGLGALGTGLLAAGTHKRGQAARDFAAAAETILARARSTTGSEALPSRQDAEQKAA